MLADISCPLIYFQEEENHPARPGYVYVGHSGRAAKRNRAHKRTGRTLIAARPGTGQGNGTDEDRLHKFFAGDRVPGRERSLYQGLRIWQYIQWLVSRGYAVTDLGQAQALPPLPYDLWRPEKMGDPFTEESGQMLLMPGMKDQRERVVYASQLVHLMSMSDQWLTPPHIIEAAREALGGTITTDPATCVQAQAWIKAQMWYTIDFDGLHREHPWRGTVWLNPPYGRGDRSAGAFARRLIRELQAGNVTAAVTCLNVNSVTTHWFADVWQHAAIHLFWLGRIDFIKPAGDDGSSPSKGTILSYFGRDPAAFCRAFGDRGRLVVTRT